MVEDRAERSERYGIVVGIDGSDGSRAAMRWAAAHTDHFGPIQPVVAWRFPWWLVPNPFPGAPAPPPSEQFQLRAERQARHELDSLGIEPTADPIVCEAAAGPTLVTIGARANLIAVGTRGRDALRGTLLGSTGMHLVTHARVPVVVVPRDLPMTPRQGPVVVGIDGSPNATAALRWALTNTPANTLLVAVMSYLDPIDVTLRPDLPPKTETAQAAERLLRTTVDETRRAIGPEAHEVTTRVLYGEPREVLEELATTAQLLVLGTRGHRGVAHLLLGSTTDALIRHPIAPVVVVPSDG
ncbi:MAG: universal stress protein [Acidimicrobiales bacterium]